MLPISSAFSRSFITGRAYLVFQQRSYSILATSDGRFNKCPVVSTKIKPVLMCRFYLFCEEFFEKMYGVGRFG